MAITSIVFSIIERVAICSVATTTIARLARDFGRLTGPIVGVLGGPIASRVGVAMGRKLGDTTMSWTCGNIILILIFSHVMPISFNEVIYSLLDYHIHHCDPYPYSAVKGNLTRVV